MLLCTVRPRGKFHKGELADSMLDSARHVGSRRVYPCLRQCQSLHAPSSLKGRCLQPIKGKCMRLYVGNLSYETGEQQLEALFATLGAVESVKVIRDQSTGRSRGFGFVEMSDDDIGRQACETLHEREFEGRRLTVNEAKPQERRDGYSGGGAGGGGGPRREPRW